MTSLIRNMFDDVLDPIVGRGGLSDMYGNVQPFRIEVFNKTWFV